MNEKCLKCLRKKQLPSGKVICNYDKHELDTSTVEKKWCKYLVTSAQGGEVMYKDYDSPEMLVLDKDCKLCKSLVLLKDEETGKLRPYCPRKEGYIVDTVLAGSSCGWYREIKKK